MSGDPRSIIGVRKHIVWTSAIGALALTVLAVVLLVVQPDSERQTQPPPDPPTTEPEQPVLLLQITEGVGSVNSALIGGSTDGKPLAMSAIPSRAAMAVGTEMRTMVSLNVALNPSLPSVSVSNTLGIRVDAGWRLDRKALAGVVDSFGGLRVSLAEPLRILGLNNQVRLRLPAGPSILDGTAAGWYATGFVNGEDEQNAQQRFLDVVEQVLIELPESPTELTQLLISLGSLSTVTTDTGRLSELLVELGRQVRAGDLQRYAVPLTRPVPIGVLRRDPRLEPGQIGAQTRYLPGLVDQRAATPRLRELYSGAPRVADEANGPRVLVWSGAAGPYQTATAMAQLVDDFVPVPAGWLRQGEELQVTRIDGRGWFVNGVPYAGAVAEVLGVPDAEVSGDTEPLVSPSPAESASGDAASPSSSALPTMPAPQSEPLGDVDVVLGNDHASCREGPPCPTPNPTTSTPTTTAPTDPDPQESP